MLFPNVCGILQTNLSCDTNNIGWYIFVNNLILLNYSYDSYWDLEKNSDNTTVC